MPPPPFDSSKAVLFDLAHGQVHLEDAPQRVLAPAAGLLQLCEAAGPDATSALARALGEPMGRRVARRLNVAGSDVMKASVEAVVDHLGGYLAIAGFGVLGAER